MCNHMFDISEIHIIHSLFLILIDILSEIIKWQASSELGKGVAKGPHFVVDVGQKFLNNQDIYEQIQRKESEPIKKIFCKFQ